MKISKEIFTQMPQAQSYKYLLALNGTFIGWTEAFPCRTERASGVSKVILKEIIPQFGLP